MLASRDDREEGMGAGPQKTGLHEEPGPADIHPSPLCTANSVPTLGVLSSSEGVDDREEGVECGLQEDQSPAEVPPSPLCTANSVPTPGALSSDEGIDGGALVLPLTKGTGVGETVISSLDPPSIGISSGVHMDASGPACAPLGGNERTGEGSHGAELQERQGHLADIHVSPTCPPAAQSMDAIGPAYVSQERKAEQCAVFLDAIHTARRLDSQASILKTGPYKTGLHGKQGSCSKETQGLGSGPKAVLPSPLSSILDLSKDAVDFFLHSAGESRGKGAESLSKVLGAERLESGLQEGRGPKAVSPSPLSKIMHLFKKSVDSSLLSAAGGQKEGCREPEQKNECKEPGAWATRRARSKRSPPLPLSKPINQSKHAVGSSLHSAGRGQRKRCIEPVAWATRRARSKRSPLPPLSKIIDLSEDAVDSSLHSAGVSKGKGAKSMESDPSLAKRRSGRSSKATEAAPDAGGSMLSAKDDREEGMESGLQEDQGPAEVPSSPSRTVTAGSKDTLDSGSDSQDEDEAMSVGPLEVHGRKCPAATAFLNTLQPPLPPCPQPVCPVRLQDLLSLYKGLHATFLNTLPRPPPQQPIIPLHLRRYPTAAPSPMYRASDAAIAALGPTREALRVVHPFVVPPFMVPLVGPPPAPSHLPPPTGPLPPAPSHLPPPTGPLPPAPSHPSHLFEASERLMDTLSASSAIGDFLGGDVPGLEDMAAYDGLKVIEKTQIFTDLMAKNGRLEAWYMRVEEVVVCAALLGLK
eukprot:gene13870-19796_t